MHPERRQLLVGILVALLAAKFLILPWIQAQSDARERLVVLTNRLDRSIGVVLNRNAITTTLEQLSKTNALERVKFPQSKDNGSFQLEAQQRVTETIEQRSLRIEVFDWILDGAPDSSGIGYIRGRILVRGDQRTIGLLLGALEGQFQNMVVREVLFNFEYPSRGSLENRTTMTLVADFYFRRKAPP